VDDRTVGEVAEGVRALLAAIDAGDMTCSPGYRSRLQGAVVALETLSGGPSNDPFRTSHSSHSAPCPKAVSSRSLVVRHLSRGHEFRDRIRTAC
jgi:hypothetical protein